MSKPSEDTWSGDILNKNSAKMFRGGNLVAKFVARKDRNRAVAEHNACLDIPTKALEAGAIKGLMDTIELIAGEKSVTNATVNLKTLWRIQEMATENLAALNPEPEGE